MTDLRTQARQVASAGRGPDTMIMHVTPDEIRDISRMGIAAGIGPVGVNPDTGYPEAGFFGDLFKGLASALPGVLGTAFLGPLGGALAQGLFTGATEDNWKKGLLAGLGTYMGGKALTGAVEANRAADAASKIAQASTNAAGTGSVVTNAGLAASGVPLTQAGQAATQAATQAAVGAPAGGFLDKGMSFLGDIPGVVTNPSSLEAGIGEAFSGRSGMMIPAFMKEVDASIRQDEMMQPGETYDDYMDRLRRVREERRRRYGANPYSNLYSSAARGYRAGGQVGPGMDYNRFQTGGAVPPTGGGYDLSSMYMYTPVPQYAQPAQNYFNMAGTSMPVSMSHTEMDGNDWDEGGSDYPGEDDGGGGQRDPRDTDIDDWSGGGGGGGAGSNTNPMAYQQMQSFFGPQGYIPGFMPERMYIGPQGSDPVDPRTGETYANEYPGPQPGPQANPFSFNPFSSGFGMPYGQQTNPFMNPNRFGGWGGPMGGNYGGFSPFGGFGQIQPSFGGFGGFGMSPYGGGGLGGFGGFNPYARRSPWGFAQGGQVNPAGGLGDGIEAAIIGPEGTMEPAALSPGEYVVPADVVSMIGDGDTDAGSDQLDLMMRRIRMQKTGSPEQLPPMDLSTLMG